jgi:hypothetical protein
MVKTKTIRIKKKGGGTRLQRVQVLASGKYKFLKNLTRRGASAMTRRVSKVRRKATPKRRKTHMGKKKRRGGGKSLVQSIEKLAKGGALLLPAAEAAFAQASTHDKVGVIGARYTGFDIRDGSFQWGRLVEGWGPYVAVEAGTRIVHKIIGIIRRI